MLVDLDWVILFTFFLLFFVELLHLFFVHLVDVTDRLFCYSLTNVVVLSSFESLMHRPSDPFIVNHCVFDDLHADLSWSYLVDQLLRKTPLDAILSELRFHRALFLQGHLSLLERLEIDVDFIRFLHDVFVGEGEHFFNFTLFALSAE